jgi:hypothetical protein
MTEGVVPRQRARTGLGPLRIWRRTWVMVVERSEDCWTRVLSRSAGWRRKAVVQPEARPARTWKPVAWKRVVS